MAHLVDERHHRVHDEDGEGHSFRICSEIADKHCNDTDADTEDHSAPITHRRCHIVGSHEDGTEKETTGEKIEGGSVYSAGLMSQNIPENTATVAQIDSVI